MEAVISPPERSNGRVFPAESDGGAGNTPSRWGHSEAIQEPGTGATPESAHHRHCERSKAIQTA